MSWARLRCVERETRADIVARAGWGGEAFIEQEFAGGEGREGWGVADAGLELPQAVGPAFLSSQGDVRVVRAVFGLEGAVTGCVDDALLQTGEIRRNSDAHEEDAGAIEESELFKMDGKGRRGNVLQLICDAGVLSVGRGAEELQRNVPRFRTGPAEAVAWALQTGANGGELFGYRGSKRYADEEAHGLRMHPCER